ncbi:MAG: glycosyltransferase family 2 protein [Candidatus Muiribacteriaceae bacterium]
MKAFSIIIPTCCRERMLRKCLYSLEKQVVKNFEVIIVNDSPETLTIPVNFSFELKVVESGQRRGPGYCRNAALDYVKTDYCAFIDDDCLPVSGWSDNIEKKVVNKGLTAAKGYVRFPGDRIVSMYLRNQIFGYNHTEEWSSTCNVVIKKSIFKNTLFDPYYTFAYEDVDFFERSSVMPVPVKGMAVLHYGKASVFSIIKSNFMYGRGAYLYYEKMKNPKRSSYGNFFLKQIINHIRWLRKLDNLFEFSLLLIIFIYMDIMRIFVYKAGSVYERFH